MIDWHLKWNGIATAIALIAWGVHHFGHLSLAVVILAFLLLNGLVVGVGRLIRSTTRYKVTTERIYEDIGILRRHSDSARIVKVQEGKVEQTFSERLLGIGRIDWDTAGTREENSFMWWGIPHPQKLEAQVRFIQDGGDDEDPMERYDSEEEYHLDQNDHED